MKVEFVPRQMDSAPLFEESDDSASMREYEFFNCSFPGGGGVIGCR
jgi:hypothetical protein